MRYLLPPTLKIVRSPTKEAEANVAFRSPGLDQSADSMAPAQCQIASVDCGSRSMNSRIRLKYTSWEQRRGSLQRAPSPVSRDHGSAWAGTAPLDPAPHRDDAAYDTDQDQPE